MKTMKKRASPPRQKIRNVTIKDIANRLGVSHSTVARALADHPLISPRTKQLVRKTAKQTGYIANSVARVMRGGPSNLIGLVIPDVQNDFYSSIAKILSQAFERKGLQLALAISEDDPALEQAIVSSLISARAGGIIIVPTAKPHQESLKLIQRTTHVQLLRRVRLINGAWFGINDRASIRVATDHLITLGHRRIGYIGSDIALSTGRDRLAGYFDAFKAHGLPAPKSFIETPKPTSSLGRDTLLEFLRQTEPPSAVVMGSIGGTLGGLQACCMKDISTPEQLSLVGFGDAPGFQWWGRGLTTIGFPVEELARDCAGWLFTQLKSPAGKPDRHEAVYPCSLIVRSSTAALKQPE